MKTIQLLIVSALVLSIAACKKSKSDPEPVSPPVAQADTKQEVLRQEASNVIFASYSDLSAKADVLYSNMTNFNTASTDANLGQCKQAWKDVRNAYEQTEGFLFGPLSVDNIDPRIDTWPIDFERMDSVMASSEVFTPAYIDGLQESLKGFHPLEYLLFGKTGNKTAAQFTAREKDLAAALALNIKTLCLQAKTSWDPATSDNYTTKFTTAGSGSAIYLTVSSAYDELIGAMAGICDEVANGKMAEPFDAQDAKLEESPFSQNSLNDFANNIKSVQNVYLGKYSTDGMGLEDLIKSNNIAMDGNIKTKIAASLTALANITVPFGQAISATNGQRTQVQKAIDTIDDLRAYLGGDVTAYLKTITK